MTAGRVSTFPAVLAKFQGNSPCKVSSLSIRVQGYAKVKVVLKIIGGFQIGLAICSFGELWLVVCMRDSRNALIGWITVPVPVFV